MAKAKVKPKSNKNILPSMHHQASIQNAALIKGKKYYLATERELNFNPDVILGIIEKIKNL
jgi:hypothetical protein